MRDGYETQKCKDCHHFERDCQKMSGRDLPACKDFRLLSLKQEIADINRQTEALKEISKEIKEGA